MSYDNVLQFDESPLYTHVSFESHVITQCDPPIVKSCNVEHYFHESSPIPICESHVFMPLEHDFSMPCMFAPLCCETLDEVPCVPHINESPMFVHSNPLYEPSDQETNVYISNVTPRPNEPPVTTHGICRLTPQTNTSLSHALWPHSCAPGKTSQEITHPKIDPHQARLTVEFLANVLS